MTWATAVSQSFGRFTYSLLFTDLRDDFDISSTAAGAMGSANLIAYMLGSLVVSMAVSRWGLDAIAQLGLAGVTAGLGLLAWSPNPWVTAGALVLTGAAAAGVWVTAPALAAGLVDPDRRGTAMGIVGSGVGIGIVLASLLDIAVGGDEFRRVYLAEFVIGMVVLAGVLATLQRREVTRRAQGGAIASLRSIPNWFRLLLEYGLFAFAMVLVMTFSVGFLEDDAGLSRGVANSVFLLIGVGTLAGGPLLGPLSDRIGRLPAQMWGLVAMVASTLVIAVGEPISALIAGFLFGVSFTGGPVSIAARVSDHLDGDTFGAAYGIVTIVFGIGLAAGPQIGGLIEDATGAATVVLLTSAAAAALATAVTISEMTQLRRGGRGVPTPEPSPGDPA